MGETLDLNQALILAGASIVSSQRNHGTVNGVEKDIVWMRFELPRDCRNLSIGDMEIERNLTKQTKLNLVRTRLINNVEEFMDRLDTILIAE